MSGPGSSGYGELAYGGNELGSPPAGGYDDLPTAEPYSVRFFLDLPEVYRHADQALGYPLLTYINGLLAGLTPVAELLDRLTYVPVDDLEADSTDTSDLLDPSTANAGWLLWLGQLVGLPTARLAALPSTSRRTLIGQASDTWDHGTPSDLAEAAAAGTVTGDPADVEVTPHYDGNPFAIGIGTLEANVTTLTTWADLKAAAPRWRDLEALGSFANASAPGPIRAIVAADARPAGYQLVAYLTD